jgi:hypothetical protein
MYGIGKMLGRTPEEYLKKRQASQKQKPPSHELAATVNINNAEWREAKNA